MSVERRPAVFLDRDGVINRAFVRDGKPFPPARLDELEVLPDVPEALGHLKALGLLLIVVTNQPDVARGTQSLAVVEEMHRELRARLPLDDVRVCYSLESEGCSCHKPRPGLLLEAARDWSIDLTRSFMIGDRWRDVGAGRAAGCRTVFIDRGYRERPPDTPDHVVSSLSEASHLISAHVGVRS